MQPRLLPHFKIKKIETIELADIPDLVECITWYMPKAEPEKSEVHDVLSRVHKGVTEGAVWFLYEEKDIVGFLVASVHKDVYGEVFYLVDDFFVMRGDRYVGQAKRLVDIGVAWAARAGFEKIVFLTKRNPHAMLRFLPGKWEIDSTVLSLIIK